MKIIKHNTDDNPIASVISVIWIGWVRIEKVSLYIGADKNKSLTFHLLFCYDEQDFIYEEVMFKTSPPRICDFIPQMTIKKIDFNNLKRTIAFAFKDAKFIWWCSADQVKEFLLR